MSAPGTMPVDIAEIWGMLPHRYPFLLIDRVTEFESGKRVLGYKNVSANEAFFQGNFPDRPVMPGVLVIEALAQAGGILTQLTSGGSAAGRLSYLVKIDNAKFRTEEEKSELQSLMRIAYAVFCLKKKKTET